MKLFALMGALLCALFLAPVVPAFAAEPVTVPIGDWIYAVLTAFNQYAVGVIVAAIVWLIRKLPSQIADFLLAAKVEQLLTRSVDYAIAATAGAAKGKVIDVRIANEVLATAATYAVKNAPTLAAKIAETLRPKLLARISDKLDLAPEVTARAVSAELPK